MAHRSSHKHTVVWLWATHTTASSDGFGTAIRKIRARADMPQRLPNRRYLYDYLLTRCKMKAVDLDPHIDRLYKSYKAFDDYVSHSTAPAGTPFPRDIGMDGSDPALVKSPPSDLSVRVRAFIRVDGRVDFSRAKMLAEFNNVPCDDFYSMPGGLLSMNLINRLTRLGGVRFPDNADVLNWEHQHKVRRTGT